MTRLETGPTLAPERWLEEAERAYDEGFTYLDWLTAVDQIDGDAPGFDVVARVLDVWTPGRWRQRVLRTRVAEGGVLDSLTPLHAGAAWHEREVYEMFGIGFAGFEDGTGLGLRRLLLPSGFEGMPLRKSFVLASRAVRPWPGSTEPGEPEAGEPEPGAASAREPEPGAASAREPEPGAASARRRRLQAPGVPGPGWGAK